MPKKRKNPTVHLDAYQPPEFTLDTCELDFVLKPKRTQVTARYAICANYNTQRLQLDGEALNLISVAIDGKNLANDQYTVDGKSLTILDVPRKFNLCIRAEISPKHNSTLSGLYQSGDMMCTQCEAQGFRRIVYGFDRPDVLTTYTTKISADKTKYPTLLSNGNLVEHGVEGETHYTIWHDPFPKPTYLFALVAGNLSRQSDNFTTRSGKQVQLHVLTRPEDEGKTEHAMSSLKRAMKWDEDTFDREYDLELYHIVAVSDFNMGAMENKSLNIFNNKYVLAREEIATDHDYHLIEGVIGHEYFHNWSGNRVTCRDWFQLSLKEGFTVLRDQEFSADMSSRGVQRINSVNGLRNAQFKEDAGPMAHPVRPDSYEEIDNFYTATIYEKGAEVVRMLRTLLGKQGFRRACNRYFETFDGQAVTTDDFVDIMEQESGLDLAQFRRWYSQAGTPIVDLHANYLADEKILQLHFKQHTPDTPGQRDKKPLFIPLKIALFNHDGKRVHFQYDGHSHDETVLHLTKPEQTICLNVSIEPAISILREFSAPIKLNFDQNAQSLSVLAQHDDDPFNRWEAMQRLSLSEIKAMIDQPVDSTLSSGYLSLYGTLLADTTTDPALLSQVLSLPSESIISQLMPVIDPDLVHKTRENMIAQIATAHKKVLHDRFVSSNANSYGQWNQEESAHRALRSTCLSMLIRLDNKAAHLLATRLYEQAACMSDTMSALSNLTLSNYKNKEHYLADYFKEYHDEELLINKWFGLQSLQTGSEALAKIRVLSKHAEFDERNPNKVYALIGGLLYGNAVTFHAQDGSGYEFAADWILKLDALNPQVAARMLGAFNHWKRYDENRQALMQTQLKRIANQAKLSLNSSEIVRKVLG